MEVKKLIQEKEGKLHILVNKLVQISGIPDCMVLTSTPAQARLGLRRRSSETLRRRSGRTQRLWGKHCSTTSLHKGGPISILSIPSPFSSLPLPSWVSLTKVRGTWRDMIRS